MTSLQNHRNDKEEGMGELFEADAMLASSSDRGLWDGKAHVGITQSGCTHVEDEGKESEASESFGVDIV
jgi:hypothetical protein